MTLTDGSFADLLFREFHGEHLTKISSNVLLKSSKMITLFTCEKCEVQDIPPNYSIWKVLGQLTQMTRLVIGLNVSEIPTGAFRTNLGLEPENLARITIQLQRKNSIINSGAFQNLNKLTEIIFQHSNIGLIKKEAFRFNSKPTPTPTFKPTTKPTTAPTPTTKHTTVPTPTTKPTTAPTPTTKPTTAPTPTTKHTTVPTPTTKPTTAPTPTTKHTTAPTPTIKHTTKPTTKPTPSNHTPILTTKHTPIPTTKLTAPTSTSKTTTKKIITESIATKLTLRFSYLNFSDDPFEAGAFTGLERPVQIVFWRTDINHLSESVFKPVLFNPLNMIFFNDPTEVEDVWSSIDCEDCKNLWLINQNKESQVKHARCKSNPDKKLFDEEVKSDLKNNCPENYN